MKNKKEILKRIARYLIPVKPLLEGLVEIECWLASQWASSSHNRLMAVQWGIPPQPEYFDHNINLFYQWNMSRSPLWLERGAFGSLTLKGGDLLELACGDGFNTRNFYSLQSRHVIAIDFEPKAIQLANKKNSAPNIEYLLSDIRENMPNGKFDNIVWDGAIEHFTPSEIEKIMINIKARLTANGILSGYTIVEKNDGKKSLSHHEYEFKSKEDLLRFLTPHFKNCTVFETIYPDRHNLYFWASDDRLPFRNGWAAVINTGS